MINPEKLNLINDARSLITDTVTSGLICAVFSNSYDVSNENKHTTFSYFSESADKSYSYKIGAEYPANHDSFDPTAVYIREVEYGTDSTNYCQYFFRSVGKILFRPSLDIDIDFLNLSDENQQKLLNRSISWGTHDSPNDLIDLNKRLLESNICKT